MKISFLRCKKNILLFMICFLSTFILTGLCKVVYANESKEINVVIPVYNNAGYLCDEDEELTGYYVEYLNEIAKITDWRYNYTIVEDDDTLIDILESGLYDIMPGIVYSEEYEELYFSYPKYSIGARRYILATRKDHETIITDDYLSLSGIKVAVSNSSTELEERFKAFIFRYGIPYVDDSEEEYPQGVNFIHVPSDQRVELLQNQSVDAILTSDSSALMNDLVAAAVFGMDPLYITVSNTSQMQNHFIEEMTEALTVIKNFDADYENRLYNKYFTNIFKTQFVLNEEEKAFLSEAKFYTVALPEYNAPYSYISYSGEEKGILVDVFNYISEATGNRMQFDYVFYNDPDMLHQIEYDIGGFRLYSNLLPYHAALPVSNPIYIDSYKIYTNKYTEASLTNGKFALTVQFPKELLEYISTEIDDIIYRDTMEECLKAVNDGTADYTVVLSESGQYYVSYLLLSNVVSMDTLLGDFLISPIYKEGFDETALGIINKCIYTIDSEMMEEYKNNIYFDDYKVMTFSKFISAAFSRVGDKIIIISCLIIIFLLIVIVMISITTHKLYKLLYVDDVTGGISYRKFMKETDRVLGKNSKEYLMVYVDINNFKYINNMFGYDVGNDVLCKTAKFIKMYADDLPFARVYADHFVVLARNRDFELFKKRMKQIGDEFETYFETYYKDFNVFFKIGLYAIGEEKEVQKIVNYANYAVDTLANVSKSQIAIYSDEMYRDVVNRQEIEKDMEGALRNREFEVYYQPKVDISDYSVMGAEALVRWNHTVKGLMQPNLFIPIFEQNRFIIEVDFYVFERVCEMIQMRMERNKKLFPISCNFSRLHLSNHNFVKRLMKVANQHGVPTKYIEIEITETVATEDFDAFTTVVTELKEQGFLLSIDDFGSGYSSIQLLHKLPIDYLKLDKTYIQNNQRNKMEDDLIKSIIMVCHSNQIRIICEGVETKEQEEFLKEHNCSFAQGYLYSRPIPLADFEEIV